jgi:peptidyl-prolyl cis-trans isomerase C
LIPSRGKRGTLVAIVLLVGLLIGVVLWLASGCDRGRRAGSGESGGAAGDLGDGVVAQVGDAQLTEAELQRIIPPELGEGLSGAEIRDVIDRWVRNQLLYQRARHDQLDRDPAVGERLHDLERDLLADELLQRELSRRVSIDNDQLLEYYRQHQDEYTQEVQLKQIVVNTREEAEEILQMLRAGANFEQLARQRSIDPTASRGGDMGFLGKDAMNAAFESHIFGQSPGAIVGPIASTFGFHVVKVAAERPADDPITFEAARDEIMHALLLEKQQAAQAALLTELRAATRVQVASTYAGMPLEADSETTDQAPETFVPGGATAIPESAQAGQD